MQQNNQMDDIEEEFRLAEQMQNLRCDVSDTETKSAKAAEFIHEIGVIYRKRSPDKIALLKSTGLFNAAIVRNPSNIVQIKSDLFEICQHILQLAKAKNQNANLVKKAEQVKNLAKNLRIKTEEFLNKNMLHITINPLSNDFQKLMSQKISAIRQLNKTISYKYKQIMAHVSQFCEDVMGKPPCEYSVAGMGSLAREEITPYSDFEHIILLSDDKNYKCHLEYFRWFSMIFHVIILNFQETIIPSLNVSSLNDKDCKLGDWYYDAITPRGISFDGFMPHACKFPLGRTQHTKNKPFETELIKPVSEMLQYLSSEADLKNGYHLADILTKTCFVFGNINIFEQFLDGVRKYLNKHSKAKTIKVIKQQVKDDMDKFSTRFCLSKLNLQNKINIKQFVYRSTTIFISALARLHNISTNNSFDIIDNLKQNCKISQNTARKLQYAVAIASEMRLKVYTKMKSQKDEAISLKQKNGMKLFLNVVGVTSTINYFQIAYCLQCEIAKQLNFTKHHFYSYPQLVNITIGLAFAMSDLAKFSEKESYRVWGCVEFDFDSCIEQLETKMLWQATTIFKSTTLSTKQTRFYAAKILNIANYLKKKKAYDEALEFYEHLLNFSKDKNKLKITNCDANNYDASITYHQKEFAENKIDNVGYEDTMLYRNISLCCMKLQKFDKALTFLHRALANFKNSALHPDQNRDIAQMPFCIEYENVCLCYYSHALTFLNRTLHIHEKTAINSDKDRDKAEMLYFIGCCQVHMGNHSDALTFLNRALDIHENTALNPDKNRNIAQTLSRIGCCHIVLCNHSDALTFLNRALDIHENIALNPDKDRNIADTLFCIGCCHIVLCNHSDALTFLNRALDIHENTAINPDKDRDIADTLYFIGFCHVVLCNHSNALTFLHRALSIYESTALNPDKDRNIAQTLFRIGSCHVGLCNHSDALTFLNRALSIYENTALNPDKDRDIARTLFRIGCCHVGLCNHSDALTFMNRALSIYENTALNPDKDRDIARTLFCIGCCHVGLCNHSDALTFLNRALGIYENTALNPDRDRNVARTLFRIGCCHVGLCNHSNALTFLHRALSIYENTALNPDKDRNIAQTLSRIGCCHDRLCNHSDALTLLNLALGIYENIALNPDKDRNIADTLFCIGCCHVVLCNHSDALTFLNRALSIYENTALNPDKDRNIADTLYFIASCHVVLCNHSDVLTFMNRALSIYENTALNPDKDRNIAQTLFFIGCCHVGLCNHSDALTFLNRALSIYKNIALNPDKDRNIADTLYFIGSCHDRLCNHSDALTFLNRALSIYENTALNSDKDRDIADALFYVGCCHDRLCNHSNALTFLNLALGIYENIAPNPDKDRNIAQTLFRIGCCHVGLCNHSDALTFLNRALDIRESTAPSSD